MLLFLFSGRRGMLAVSYLGRNLSRSQLTRPGY